MLTIEESRNETKIEISLNIYKILLYNKQKKLKQLTIEFGTIIEFE